MTTKLIISIPRDQYGESVSLEISGEYTLSQVRAVARQIKSMAKEKAVKVQVENSEEIIEMKE